MIFPDSRSFRPALDTTRYDTSTPELLIAADLASLAVEITGTGEKIDPNRIWWYDSLPEKLSTEKTDFPSSLAALELKRLITETPSDQKRLILWVSPAYQHLEARINLLFTENQNGQISFDAFGIPVKETAEESERRLVQFTPRSDTPDLPNLTGLDAVTTPLCATLDSTEDLFQTAKTWIDLPPEIWRQIFSGEIKDRSRQLITDLIPVAQGLQANLKNHLDPYLSGAQAESEIVAATGRQLDFSASDCGPSNSGFLQSSSDHQSVSASEQTSCREIVCPRCAWKPDPGQLRNVLSGSLKTCPCCNWPEQSVQSGPAVEPAFNHSATESSSVFIITFSWAWLSDWWNAYHQKPSLDKNPSLTYNT